VRTALMRRITDRASSDPSIMFVTGDLGFTVVDEFRDLLPKQFINCGVAEQAMMSMAAGIASTSKRVFAYSISNFATFRCLEQIRNDITFHGHSVCIVSVGAGASYGTLGYSHHGLEDLAIMRVLPGMRIFSPADSYETASAIDAFLDDPGPTYLRLGRAPTTQIHAGVPNISRGALEVRSGSDASILATGSIVSACVSAADALLEMGVDIQVVSVPRIKPFPIGQILELTQGRSLITVEEHSTTGGLGSALLESLTSQRESRFVSVLGFPPEGLKAHGSQEFLNKSAGMDAAGIKRSVIDHLLAQR